MAAHPHNPPIKLNMDPSPCNESAERRNWTKLSNLDDGINTDRLYVGAMFDQDGTLLYQEGKFYGDFIYKGISIGESTGKVKINEADELEFLEEKFTFVHDEPEFAEGDLQVEFDVFGLDADPVNAQLDAFIPMADFNGDVSQVFWHIEGVFTWRTPVEITVVTDYQVDGTTMKLQKKTRTVTVLISGDESEWIDVHTGTEECPEEE